MSYRSFLQDDSYYKGSVHNNDTSIPTLRVVNRCFEEDTELDSYQRFINMQPLSLKTGLFGTVKLINDRDANKKTKTVGQHQKQERKNRFQTGNYPSNKNASASRELRALSEMKLLCIRIKILKILKILKKVETFSREKMIQLQQKKKIKLMKRIWTNLSCIKGIL